MPTLSNRTQVGADLQETFWLVYVTCADVYSDGHTKANFQFAESHFEQPQQTNTPYVIILVHLLRYV